MPGFVFGREMNDGWLRESRARFIFRERSRIRGMVLVEMAAAVPTQGQHLPTLSQHDIQGVLVPTPDGFGMFVEAAKKLGREILTTPLVQIDEHHATVEVGLIGPKSKFTIVGNGPIRCHVRTTLPKIGDHPCGIDIGASNIRHSRGPMPL